MYIFYAVITVISVQSSNTFFIMSITTSTINVRGNLSTCNDIPYIKYFELCSYENWSLHHYDSLIIDNYKLAEKDRAHQVFFNTLQSINNNLSISQEIRDIAQKLIKNRKVNIIYK